MEIQNAVNDGYYGTKLSNIPNDLTQSCRESENNLDFKLEQKASLRSDEGVISIETQQSSGPGLYSLDNIYGCDCGLEKARNVQLLQPAVNFNAGVGYSGEKGCLIDKDTNFRFDKLTNENYINQLPTRQNAGFFQKGVFDVETENIIRSNNNSTYHDKPCNYPGASTFQYSYTPLIPQLKSEVQDTKYIVQEDSLNSWIRGGIPSRQLVRDADYMKRCQEEINNKKIISKK